MSKFTKKRIIDAFLSLLEKKSLDKLTVKDIIQTAEVNRNTFYYYFEDIYDLLQTVFEEKSEDFYNAYVDNDDFYECCIGAADIVINNRQAMIHIYKSKDRSLILKYMESVTKLFIERFVRKAAEGKNISDKGIEYITCFYSYAFAGNIAHWIEDNMPPYREELLKHMAQSFNSTVDTMIENAVNL